MTQQPTKRGRRAPSEPAGGWLQSHEESAWKAAAVLFVRLPAALEAQMQRDSGISLFDYLVMSTISMSPEREMRMSDLAQLIDASPSRLSNVVKRLEQRGWVVRQSHTCDGRAIVAVLTDSGMDVVRSAAPGHVDAVRSFLIEPLTRAQQDVLSSIGERVGKRLNQCEPPSA